MKNEYSKININFEQLGKSFRIYGTVSIIIEIIVFFTSFIGIMGGIMTISTIPDLISFIEIMKGIIIASLIFSSIELAFFAHIIFVI